MARRYCLILLVLFFFCQGAAADIQGIDDQINQWMTPIANTVAGFIFSEITILDISFRWIVVWLITAALFFTFYLGFINVRGFRHALDLVRGRYTDPKHPGEVTHLQALTTALSGTVGLGNIAGVAVAITVGGPGAVFWMILAGFLGMSSKFAECTLGVKYRHVAADGTVSGGPMYYLSQGLKEKNLAPLGKFLAVFFAVCCVGGSFGGGNLFQANQSFQMVVKVTGGDASFWADKGWLYGLVIAIIVGSVIIGGVKSIAQVAVRVVPMMALIYIVASLVIIFVHLDKVPSAFALIIKEAFFPMGIVGGMVGVMIQGFQRAAFSNEAGIGSSPIVHSAVVTDEPVTEGFVALLEPFIDTVVICTMTALVIIVTGAYQGSAEGVDMTSNAFASTIGWFPYVLAVAVVFFALSTLLSWSYYGNKAWTYLFGHSKVAELSYKLLFCGVAVIGSSMQLDPVIALSDAMIFSMSLANLLGLYLLAPVVKRELSSYLSRLKSGEIKPYKNQLPSDE